MASFKLFLFFSFLLFFLQPSRSDQICPSVCGPVPIHFPFQMISILPKSRCGYPGFTITCQNQTQIILTIPFSGDFIIESISYLSQLISITDPSNCTAKRLLEGFDSFGTPFQPVYTRNFTFLNCSSDSPIFQSIGALPIPCLSDKSYSVFALPTDRYNLSNMFRCTEIANVLYPTWGQADLSDSIGDYMTLTWTKPDCQLCERVGGYCQFKDDINLEVGCFQTFDTGFPTYVRYVALFVVVSGLCIIGFIVGIRRKIEFHGQDQGQLPSAEISNSTYTPQLQNVVAKGLDTPTIEMYPTTLLGESLQLPKPTDNICPICLLEYQAKDTLRTIPSCMHYFHVDCIDEWLKRNATCPLCRN
ncbi:hypothetical protein REPUB_Repub07fG0180900 [Reevesia pubescens]